MPVLTGSPGSGGAFVAYSTSGVGAAQTVQTPVTARQVRAVGVQYSASTAPSIAVTIKNDTIGAAYNLVIGTIAVAAGVGTFLPTAPFDLAPGDYVEVVAPLLAGQTSTVQIRGRA